MDARPSEMLAYAQSAYFAATGVWPIVHMPSFLRVTGPKTDLWWRSGRSGDVAHAMASLV